MGRKFFQQILSPSGIPLTITAKSDNVTIKLTSTGSPAVAGLQYKPTAGADWTTYTIGTIITLNAGEYVQFRNTSETLSSPDNYVKFVITGSVAAAGNLLSMLNFSKTIPKNGLTRLFQDCDTLISAPDIPADTINNYGCNYMFAGCTALQVPMTTLPARNLGIYAYNCMFYGCTSLTAAPELPATTLAQGCYAWMFRDCSNLIAPPGLPAEEPAANCYQRMFQGCSSIQNIELDLTSLAAYSLSYMCNGCSNLLSVKVKFVKWTDYANRTEFWLGNVPANGTFYKPSDLIVKNGVSYIPSSWTVINID